MRALLRVRRAFVAVVAGALVAMLTSGCTAARPDRAGGGAARGPRVVVQLATEGDAPPTQVKLWAEKVQDRSPCDTAIHYLTWQQQGDRSYEGGIMVDVRPGAVDGARVGAQSTSVRDMSKPWVRQ